MEQKCQIQRHTEQKSIPKVNRKIIVKKIYLSRSKNKLSNAQEAHQLSDRESEIEDDISKVNYIVKENTNSHNLLFKKNYGHSQRIIQKPSKQHQRQTSIDRLNRFSRNIENHSNSSQDQSTIININLKDSSENEKIKHIMDYNLLTKSEDSVDTHVQKQAKKSINYFDDYSLDLQQNQEIIEKEEINSEVEKESNNSSCEYIAQRESNNSICEIMFENQNKKKNNVCGLIKKESRGYFDYENSQQDNIITNSEYQQRKQADLKHPKFEKKQIYVQKQTVIKHQNPTIKIIQKDQNKDQYQTKIKMIFPKSDVTQNQIHYIQPVQNHQGKIIQNINNYHNQFNFYQQQPQQNNIYQTQNDSIKLQNYLHQLLNNEIDQENLPKIIQKIKEDFKVNQETKLLLDLFLQQTQQQIKQKEAITKHYEQNTRFENYNLRNQEQNCLIRSYNENNLHMLDKELKQNMQNLDLIDLDIDSMQIKCFNINNENYKNQYTLYEYCLLLQKYRNIRQYCEQKFTQIYTIDKYFDYCKQGNIGGVYFCIIKGVNAQRKNERDGLKDAFIYACEKSYVEMLLMLIKNFQVDPNQGAYLKIQENTYKNATGFMIACEKNNTEIIQILINNLNGIIDKMDQDGQTGFLIACIQDNVEIVKILTNKYPEIIFQRDKQQNSGFVLACENGSLDTIVFLMCKYPNIVHQKNSKEQVAYDELSENQKIQIGQKYCKPDQQFRTSLYQ